MWLVDIVLEIIVLKVLVCVFIRVKLLFIEMEKSFEGVGLVGKILEV